MVKEVSVMKRFLALALAGMVCAGAVAASPEVFKKQAFKMREDFGTEPLSDCYLQYYYYIPCPTYTWFWAWYYGTYGDMRGTFFRVGDTSTGSGQACDPLDCHRLEMIRILDFAGYGTIYPDLFTVVFDIWCSDEYGCPVGPSLWNSGLFETNYAWTYITVDPPLCITDCCVDPGPPPGGPRVLVTATHVGLHPWYPQWGMDNISTALFMACEMHDVSSLAALYPRPYNSHYETVHSGFYGNDFRYCPPLWFYDGRDTSTNGTQYGCIELAWRIYLSCTGPSATEPTTWGNIKSMYR